MKRLAEHLVWCWLLSQLVVPLRAADSARLVKYSQTDVVPIHAKVRFSTLIVLPADEEILDFHHRRQGLLDHQRRAQSLLPASGPGSDSQQSEPVTASGHIYSFLLTEISKETDTEPDLKVFIVPSEESNLAATSGPGEVRPG